jgi:hypothetical protein
LLEQAIVGQTTITMANADYTLSDLNGASDEARNAVIIVTGSQNATYSVIVPAVPKLYMVTNSLGSSAIAYIKPSGGSAVQVPNGRTMYLYCTGTAFVALDYVQYAQSLVTGGSITTGAIDGTTITASTQFSGPGTGLTGTAVSLTVGAASTASVSTTQAAGTNNTTIATTAFVQTAIASLYPVGSIYSSTVATNPNTLFGFGTWVAFAAGRVMIGNGGGFSAGSTGGSADAVLVQHNHGGITGIDSPDHLHSYSGTTSVENQGHIHQNAATGGSGVVGPNGGPAPDLEEGAGAPNVSYGDMGLPNAQHTHTFAGNTSGVNVNHQHGITTEGSTATNANLQPYIVVYMWNRTA